MKISLFIEENKKPLLRFMPKKSLTEIDTPKLIEDIRSGNETVIDQIYLTYKPEFINWASTRFSISQEDIIDCWQDCVIAFYEQIIAGRLTKLDVTLKTYLFAIGRNKLLYKLRTQKSNLEKEQVFAEDYFLENDQIQGFFDLENIKEEQEKKLEKAIKSLSKKNRNILIRRYYDGFSLEKIQELGNYKSINAVSATLSRALSNLKKVINPEKIMRFLLSF